ncbi:MAG: cyclopropane-fatty-acyl-phospholipid synthase family protein [Actinobacteria bacterium]|nr:cyclopropane-fatty-acyl-phospholipid synthase family protein [Actinomycetota bacterium]
MVFATIDRIFQQMSRELPDVSFRTRMWDGTEHQYGSGPQEFLLSINSAAALTDVLTRGSLGFGEAYMAGAVDVEGDLQALIRFAFLPTVSELHLGARDKGRLLAHAVKHRNTQRRSRENVQHHYDLGNDFYRLWLDESMTYSCAYWGEECETLDQAQWAKYDHICRKLHLQPGDRLVDIGCGWGGMLAQAAAEYGVEGVGCTLSTEQHAYAERRLKDLGLHPRVRVELADYREVRGEFDKFVSIGMFEHVGEEYYGVFFDKVRELLVEGGIGVLHTIGKERERDIDPWVGKYIFPGAHLPTLAQIVQNMGERHLAVTDVENLRLHYAHTLEAWTASFEAHESEVRERLGDSFVRMWRFYLNSTCAGFKWGDSRVFQVAFTNGLRSDLPLTRAYLYA